VSFLTTERDEIALRVAAFDRVTPLEGSDTGSVIRRGAPLYFQWVAGKRVLVHIGGGESAFTGQVGLDGAAVGAPIAATGGFRPATLSHDGRYVAYAAATTGAEGDIVVQAADGQANQRLHVFGPAAMLFDPVGVALATIAPDEPDPQALTVPVGPLRLIDPVSGAASTLLDGSVVAFFWSPDGKTIAAIRVVGSGSGPAAGIPFPQPAIARPSAPKADGIALATGSPVELELIDVYSGKVRAQSVVTLAATFIQLLLPYFDQYALSHELWSPDSTAFLIPLVSAAGQGQLTIVPADGSDPVPIADGLMGSWSP
jgi:TolB protein